MRLNRLEAVDYKIFEKLSIDFDGRSTVIFGVNGMGKSTILSAVNHLFRVWINRINPAQGKAYEGFSVEMIHIGSSELSLSAQVELTGDIFPLTRSYGQLKPGKKQPPTYDKKMYAAFTEKYLEHFIDDNEMRDIPIFINYGTNRSVLDIPLRIKLKHDFSQISALEYAVENALDFRTFFEWFRNQEDLENQIAREEGKLHYKDKQLSCVRKAIESMLGDVSGLKVNRNPLCMFVTKKEKEVRVDMLSDGEKCTLALFGDLARRLAIANPNRDNPLEGEGIVLIDEIELHMHPSWQRKILGVLKEVFPNIQFIVTTHSPQVLGEADDSYNILLLSEDEGKGCKVSVIKRMDGFDSNLILEEYMDTASKSLLKKTLVTEINDLIVARKYEEVKKKLAQLKDMASDIDEDYILAEGYMRRRKLLDEKDKP